MDHDELLSLLRTKGFSERIINAFKNVKRESFVPKDLRRHAYEDVALALTEGATISQPSTIAIMLDLLELKGHEDVLEIGSGSGYVLALLAQLTKGHIYGIEILAHLAAKTKKAVKKYGDIIVTQGDGMDGMPECAPFDRILISAAAPELPVHLYRQLSEPGIIVSPVGTSIFRIKKNDGVVVTEEFPGFAFVPLQRS